MVEPKYPWWEPRLPKRLIPKRRIPKCAVPSKPTLCDYCHEPFGFDEWMTRIEKGIGQPCDLVHANCAHTKSDATD